MSMVRPPTSSLSDKTCTPCHNSSMGTKLKVCTYIDALLKSNAARFVNHSCEPNLEPRVSYRSHR